MQLLPRLDDLTEADAKLKLLAAITRAVKLGTVLQRAWRKALRQPP
jgi:hypothetical protein